jgi:formylglycine-generating enzyme
MLEQARHCEPGLQEAEAPDVDLTGPDRDRKLARSFNLVLIPPGALIIGDTTGTGHPQERPAHEVTLSGYWIGKYCVTAAEYLAFINAQGDRFNDLWCDFIDPCFISRTTRGYRLRPDAGPYPMVQVSFVGAAAYCNWLSERCGLPPIYDLKTLKADIDSDGFRLPTEAEWERASIGPGDDGGTPSIAAPPCRHHLGSMRHLRAGYRHIGGFHARLEGPLPVGTLPANLFGLHEMFGNVNQWCHDRYAAFSAERQQDPSGPGRGSFRVIRGGCFLDADDKLRPSYRHGIHNDAKCMIDGFRIARRHIGTAHA